MKSRDVVLLSVQSPHVEKILAGTKTVEFRRRPMNLSEGTVVLLYAAGTRRALVGSFVSGVVTSGSPAFIWRRHREGSGLTRAEYVRYFEGAEIAYAVETTAVRGLPTPIELEELRDRWPRFTAPRTHRRVHSAELRCILNGEQSLLLR